MQSIAYHQAYGLNKKSRIKRYDFFGGDGEIWTLAPIARPTPLAGAPLHHLSTSPKVSELIAILVYQIFLDLSIVFLKKKWFLAISFYKIRSECRGMVGNADFDLQIAYIKIFLEKVL